MFLKWVKVHLGSLFEFINWLISEVRVLFCVNHYLFRCFSYNCSYLPRKKAMLKFPWNVMDPMQVV